MAVHIVREVLSDYAERTRAELFGFLPSGEPRKYLYDLCADYPRRGGRGLRPGLCIATARAFGGRIEDVLNTAVSIEILHNAMLIHDDIEDESDLRRGKPTLHAAEGTAIAINVGDTLSLIGMRPLLENRRSLGSQLALRIFEETERMALESAEGQALELGWRRDNVRDLSEADYLHLVLKKTCWLAAIHPMRVGALIGTMGRIDPDPFIRFGFFLGAAFQIQDDLLNLVGDEARYGKEIGGDILEGKRTLMLIHLLKEATAGERDRVHALLGQPRAERAAAEVRWVLDAMDRYGSIEYARGVAHALAGAALHEGSRLIAALPDSRDKQFLAALPEWVIARA